MRFPPIILFYFIGILLYFPIFFAGLAGDDYPHFYIVHQYYQGNILAPFSHVVGTPEENRLLGYFYRPLPFALYVGISTLFGANPLVFHLLQVILYIIAGYLFYVFCSRIFHKKVAFLLGIIFLIHPANNDLGAYIAALDETVCLLFGLLTLLLIKRDPSLWRLGGVFGTLLLAFFSKETAIIFTVLSFVYAGYKRVFIYLMPIIASFVTYLALRILAASQPVYKLTPSPTADLSVSEHLFLALQIAFSFFREIVMPTRAGIKPEAFTTTWEGSIFSTIMLIFILSLCVIGWRIIKRYSAKQAALFGFFACWMLLGIPLHLQFIPLEVIFADRWLYITEMGLLGMLGVVFTLLQGKKGKWIAISRTLFFVLLFFYAVETIVLNIMWLEWEKYFI